VIKLDFQQEKAILMAKGKDKSLVGAAGEHLVLSRLLSRDLLASQAPRGTRKADVLVNPLDGGKPRLIQVKTRTADGGALGWHMGLKHESISEKDLFYTFVNLELINPSVYVIPSRIVAKVVRESHAEWLATPGKNGRKHNDSEMRRIKNDYGPNFTFIKPGWMDKYLEAWELLD
jgi:hypothetical protein